MVDDKTFPAVRRDRTEIQWQDYPVPIGGSRFIPPVSLRQALREHPLGRDLYPYSISYAPHDIRRRYPLPLSPCYVLFYCLSGEVRLATAARNWSIGIGDLAIIPPDLGFVIDAVSPWTSYCTVSYYGEQSNAYTKFLNAPDLVTHLGLRPEIVIQFEAMCDLRSSVFTLDTFIYSGCQLKLLMTSISLALTQKGNHSPTRIDLDQVRKLMAQRLDGSLNLEELADSVHLSSYHFARIFKKLTGQSPMRYFTRMRLQQACHLLEVTRQPIKQVAHAVGYADPQYFSQIFRQTFGVTPQAYRNRSSSVAEQDTASQWLGGGKGNAAPS